MFIKNKFYSILLILLLSVFFLLINRFVPRWHKIESFSNFNEIKADFSGRVSKQVTATNDNASELYDQNGDRLFFVCRSKFCQVAYSFSQPTNIRKISVLYQGNFSQEKEVAFQFDDDVIPSKNIVKNCSQTDGLCSYYFDNQSKIYDLRIILNDAQKKNYGIREIKFYTSQTKNIISSIFDYFFVWPRSYPVYFFYPILFFILILTPGMLFYNKNLLTTFLTSIIIYIPITLTSIILPPFMAKFLILLTFILFIFLILKRKKLLAKIINKDGIIILIYFISVIYLSFNAIVKDFSSNIKIYDFYENYNTLTPTVPYGTYEVDFLIPYHGAINFAAGGEALKQKIGTIYNLTDRTPLLSFLMIYLGKAFGMNVFIYQMLVIMFSNLFIISAFYVAKLSLGSIKSYLLALVLSFSHFFIFTTLFAPTKTATLFFIIAATYYLLRLKKNYLFAGIVMAIAYLCHPFALVYFIPFSLYVLVKSSSSKRWKELMYFVAPTIISVMIWHLFSSSLGTNNLIYQSIFFSSKDWIQASDAIYESKQWNIIDNLIKISFQNEFWINKFYNLIGFFFFLGIIKFGDRFYDYFKTTIPGALGNIALIVFIFKPIYLFFTKKTIHIDKTKKDIVLYFILLPIFFILFYQGFYILMGLMWYALGVLPFLLILLYGFYNTQTLKILSILIISESYYLTNIYDINQLNRIMILFGNSNLFFKLGFIYLCLLAINIFFFGLISRNDRSINSYGKK